MLCGLVIEGVFNVIDDLEWSPGEDYTVISFSIDPNENHETAAKAKAKYLSQLEANKAQDGWYFLTGSKSSIDLLTNSVGFKYKEIEQTGEYAHSAAIMFLSPAGMVTRYLYGISFDEFNVRNALYEAADGKIGSTVSRVVMYCYQYDPSSDTYVPVAINIMKIGGLATLLILGIFLGLLWVREKRKKQSHNYDLH
jgi:protein SCO1/2